jgi:hypothetical protein
VKQCSMWTNDISCLNDEARLVGQRDDARRQSRRQGVLDALVQSQDVGQAGQRRAACRSACDSTCDSPRYLRILFYSGWSMRSPRHCPCRLLLSLSQLTCARG